MNHDEIYKQFKNIFIKNQDDNIIIEWKPVRKNSISIKYKNGDEYIFSYKNKHSFSFETVEHFIERKE